MKRMMIERNLTHKRVSNYETGLEEETTNLSIAVTTRNGKYCLEYRGENRFTVTLPFTPTHDQLESMLVALVDAPPKFLSKTETNEERTHKDLNQNLDTSVHELVFSIRIRNYLENTNVNLVGELVQKHEADLLKAKNFGRHSLKEVKERLAEMGLSLGMKLKGWVPPNQRKE